MLTNKAEITTSYLIIQKAQIEDGGIYSCENGVVDPAKVKVHVLTGNNIKISFGIILCVEKDINLPWRALFLMIAEFQGD